MTDLWFPATTFLRVFDTEPMLEVLSLPELVAAMRRFEVRSDTKAAVERELGRIARARAEVEAGGAADGPAARRLLKARADAEKARKDPVAAVAAEAAKLEDDARRDAKKDLRLWSPARYRPGAKRGSEGVDALGCVVLDYDAGVSVEDAASTWEEWFHVLHTTWSHRDDRHRFRVVIPLARLVAVEDWAPVWAWAAERAEGLVDHALKGAGATYALPAVQSIDAPRLVTVHAGELLDPALLGIPLRPVAPMSAPSGPPVRMMRGDVKREVVE